jgi:hypothetical protein
VLDEQEIAWEPLSATARPDDAASEVSVTARGTLTTVAFRQDDLDKLVQESVMQQHRTVVVPGQVQYAFAGARFDAGTGILSFALRVTGPGYAVIDTAEVVADIMGKRNAEIRRYFSQREDVQSASLELSLPWLRAVPTDPDKVGVQLNYDQPEP